jgi:hypothetical protein
MKFFRSRVGRWLCFFLFRCWSEFSKTAAWGKVLPPGCCGRRWTPWRPSASGNSTEIIWWCWASRSAAENRRAEDGHHRGHAGDLRGGNSGHGDAVEKSRPQAGQHLGLVYFGQRTFVSRRQGDDGGGTVCAGCFRGAIAVAVCSQPQEEEGKKIARKALAESQL